jgi:hypothetical protein
MVLISKKECHMNANNSYEVFEYNLDVIFPMFKYDVTILILIRLNITSLITKMCFMRCRVSQQN